MLCVDPARIEEIWPHVAEFIMAAFDRGADDCTDDVHGDLLAQRALLWVAWDGDAVLAAATTKLLRTARGSICVITSCGGREMGIDRWRAAIRPIERYAVKEGCAIIRVEGRRGWQAVFPDYREAWVALEKRL